MFEKISFFSYRGDYTSADREGSEEYGKMVEQEKLNRVEKEEYWIDGRTRVLFPHPVTRERKEKLIYLQAFCYMESGARYYTRRSEYASFLLLYTYQGRGKLTYEGKAYSLNENDIFLIDCRKPHFYQTDGELWKHADLHFFGGISEYLYQENFSGRLPVFHVQQPANFQKHLEGILSVYTGSSLRRDFLFSSELERLLLWMIEEPGDIPDEMEMPENIRLLTSYMERHFQKDMSLDEMSAFANMSKYHLCRKFKQYTGFSPKEYVNYLRILEAEMLLRDTKFPGYRIGMMVGFPSEANFIRHFRKKNGITPGEYRAACTEIE